MERNGNCSIVVGDITEEETIPFDRSRGEESVNLIFGSVMLGPRTTLAFLRLKSSSWHWDQQIALNLRPHFVAARAQRSTKPGSSIIGISSIAGIRPAVRFACLAPKQE